MKSLALFSLLFAFLCSPVLAQGARKTSPLDFEELPSLPDPEGFAGMYAGVSRGALLLAGGANFPEKRAWDGGKKVWYDHIFVLESPGGTWRAQAATLPQPMAYGASVTHDDGVICVGGSDAGQHHADAFALRFDGEKVTVEELPPLPTPLASMGASLVGDVLYVAGGSHAPDATAAQQRFLGMDLAAPGEERRWVELPSWPGPERTQCTAASIGGAFFLAGGHRLEADAEGKPRRVEPFLRDAYLFTPDSEDWRRGDWKRLRDAPQSFLAVPSPAPVLGSRHVLFLGGVSDDIIGADAQNHPGFTREILAYHSGTNTWLPLGELPDGASRVTAPTTRWNDRWVVASGETRPSVRSPDVYTIGRSPSFGWVNWAMLTVYLAAVVAMGFYVSRREKGTEDFFLAGRRIPWWAAGLSIYSTQLSGITFMAVPEEAYLRDWATAFGGVMILVTAPIIIHCFLPFFRRLRVTSAYEYLERRFSLAVRWFGSLSFLVFQVGRMGIVLYLPAVALAAVTGIDIYLCILVMGVISIAYTVLGGIEAVIWTDVLQTIVLLGGALLCLVVLLGETPGGLGSMIEVASERGKLEMFDFRLDHTGRTFWVLTVGFFFLTLTPYATDQTVIQRYLTTPDEKAAARAIWLNAVFAILATLIFFSLGTALFVFYEGQAAFVDAEKSRQILPWFIVEELPVGVAGLVIAGVFAASMSSLDSSMNSMETTFVTDFHRHFRPDCSDHRRLRLARWLTVLFGVIGSGTAILLAATDVQSIFEFFQLVLGMLGGSLTGVFILGIFTRRACAAGVLLGAGAGTAVPLILRFTTDTSAYLFGAVGVVTCCVVGYATSLFKTEKPANIDGLTLYTMRR